jgi:hypothetical protein
MAKASHRRCIDDCHTFVFLVNCALRVALLRCTDLPVQLLGKLPMAAAFVASPMRPLRCGKGSMLEGSASALGEVVAT